MNTAAELEEAREQAQALYEQVGYHDVKLPDGRMTRKVRRPDLLSALTDANDRVERLEAQAEVSASVPSPAARPQAQARTPQEEQAEVARMEKELAASMAKMEASIARDKAQAERVKQIAAEIDRKQTQQQAYEETRKYWRA